MDGLNLYTIERSVHACLKRCDESQPVIHFQKVFMLNINSRSLKHNGSSVCVYVCFVLGEIYNTCINVNIAEIVHV